MTEPNTADDAHFRVVALQEAVRVHVGVDGMQPVLHLSDAQVTDQVRDEIRTTAGLFLAWLRGATHIRLDVGAAVPK